MSAYRISVSKGDRVSVAVSVLQAIDREGSTPTPRIKIIDPDGSLARNIKDENGVFAEATMDSDGLATIIVTDDYKKNTLQYSVQVNCTGTCTGSLDGDEYLAGYQDGFQVKEAYTTGPDTSLPTFSFNNNILHLPVVQVILNDSFSLYEAQLKLDPEKGCFVLEEKNTHSIESSVSNCSAPKVNSMLIDKPDCEQLWRYRVFGVVALDDLQQKRHLLRAKLDDRLNERVMRNAAIGLAGNLSDIVDLKNLPDASDEALEKVLLNMGIDLPEMINELILPDNVNNEITIEFSYLIMDLMKLAIDATGGDVSSVVSGSSEILATAASNFYATLSVNEITERFHEVTIVSDYLFYYYRFGGSSKRLAEHFSLNSSASTSEIIKAIASHNDIENGWFTEEYNETEARNLLDSIMDRVNRVATSCQIGKCLIQ